MSERRGRFLTVEGGEGVGKTVFVERFTAALRAQGLQILQTREPGGTLTADRIRAIFAQPPEHEALTPQTEALLVSASRAEHVAHAIQPALARGEWVVCDRFADSTRVYQGVLGGLSRDFLEQLIGFSTFGLVPDLTLWLDCDVTTALSRLSQRRQPAASVNTHEVNRYDLAQRDVHERLHRGYAHIAAEFPQRIFRVDASQDPAAVVAQALNLVQGHFS